MKYGKYVVDWEYAALDIGAPLDTEGWLHSAFFAASSLHDYERKGLLSTLVKH